MYSLFIIINFTFLLLNFFNMALQNFFFNYLHNNNFLLLVSLIRNNHQSYSISSVQGTLNTLTEKNIRKNWFNIYFNFTPHRLSFTLHWYCNKSDIYIYIYNISYSFSSGCRFVAVTSKKSITSCKQLLVKQFLDFHSLILWLSVT